MPTPQQYQQYAQVQQYQQQMQQYTAQAAAQHSPQQYQQYAQTSHAIQSPVSSANGYLQPGRPKGGVVGRKGKKMKDPNRPKRPLSAYFFFIASKREEAKSKGQHISKVAEWTKQVSAIWRELTPVDKQCFDVQAVTDKKRYEQQMQAYSGKKPKDVNRPKRPQCAYFLFLADFRSKNKGKFTGEGSHKELIRAAGEAWNNLQPAEKIPYEGLAEKEKRKYEEAMKIYNQKDRLKALKKLHVETIVKYLNHKDGGGGGMAAKQAKLDVPTQLQQVHHFPPNNVATAVVDDDEDDDDEEDE